MTQIKSGTVTVTNGSATVTGSGTSWLGNVSAGDYFIVRESSGIVGRSVVYEVAGVASDTSLSLTAPWAGDTASDVAYVVHIDFQPSGLPKMLPGDLESAPIFNRAMQQVANGTLGLNNATVSTGTGTQTVPNALDSRTIPVNTVAALRALPGAKAGLRVDVAGEDTAFDGNGASYIIEVKDGSPESDTVIFLDDTVHQARLIPITTSTGTQTLVEALDDRVVRNNATHLLISRVKGTFNLVSHRGREWGPENTTLGLAALPDMCRAIEFDVRITSDGQVICMHDNTVNRTTDGTGTVEDLTFSYIQGLDAGSWYSSFYDGARVPTGKEYIEAARRKGVQYLLMDVKTIRDADDVQKYVDLIEDCNAWDFVISIVRGESELALWRSVDTRSLLGSFSVTATNGRIEALIEHNGCLALAPPGSGSIPGNQDMFRQAKEAGLLVGASTTNVPAEFEQGARSDGLEFILTDYASTFVPFTGRFF